MSRIPSHSAKLAYAHDHCVFGSTYLRRYDDAVPRRRMDVANGSNCPRWRLHFCGRFVARTRVDQMKAARPPLRAQPQSMLRVIRKAKEEPELEVRENGVNVTFKPPKSEYSFSPLANVDERYGRRGADCPGAASPGGRGRAVTRGEGGVIRYARPPRSRARSDER